MDLKYVGNKDLLRHHKTAFLASGKISSEEVMQCYDWATEMRDRGECVVSGFSSKLEQDVLHFLLKGSQPIIIVLARRMYKQLPEQWQQALDSRRLLIISTSDATRQSKATAAERNRYVAGLCESIRFAGVSPESSLYPLFAEYKEKVDDKDTSVIRRET